MPKGLFDRHKLPPRSKSGLKGVIYQPSTPPLKRPWKSYGRHHGMFVCLGYSATKEEAARIYDAWAVKRYGPDTYLNRV